MTMSPCEWILDTVVYITHVMWSYKRVTHMAGFQCAREFDSGCLELLILLASHQSMCVMLSLL